MKYFIGQVVTYFIFLFALFLFSLSLILIETKKISELDYDGGLKLKLNRLVKYKEYDKIILIGGSNVAMGFNSIHLSEKFQHYTVINFGHRFQFGIEYYLREVKPYIKENDIVIIIPEYQLLLNNYFDNNQLNTVYFENLHNQSLSNYEILKMLRYTKDYFVSRFLLRNRTEKEIKDHNKLSGFNKFGDLTCHWDMIAPRPIPIYVEPSKFDISKHTLFELKNFISYCKKNKIKLMVIPPAFAESSFNKNLKLIKWNQDLFSDLGVPFQVNPEKFKFNDSLFFDSPYHLLKEGATQKTKIIENCLINSNIQIIK